MHPDWDVYTIDADNAFNRANRIKGLQQVQQLTPELLPYLRDIYLCSSFGWFNDGNEANLPMNE